ncbi:fatty acid synthase S-acetyltransferase [Xylariaceae sp. FL0662B]|nr:fatty acid synthase S-acetyltransferase [Xylariaceae sp. FL0662B]
MAHDSKFAPHFSRNGANGHASGDPNGFFHLQNRAAAYTTTGISSGHHVSNGAVNDHSNGEAAPVEMTRTYGHHINGRLNDDLSNGEAVHAQAAKINEGYTNTVPTNGVQADNGTASPMAICGMALRLPGGLSTPQEFWQFLLKKGDARCRVPKSRFNIDAYYAPGKKPAHVGTEYGFFLDDSVDLSALDTSFFSPGRAEAERLDPQQRLLLEVSRECFEDAGITGWKGKSVGSYVGSFGEDWQEMGFRDNQPYGIHRVGGSQDFMLANRISYEMGFQGPTSTVRTACSSSLTALDEACMALSRGDCEVALVSGVNLILTPTMMSTMTEQGVLSPDGSCKSFSADANGYARGEAVAAIVVKPLADAVRDGNPVRAVIRATSCNANGNLGAGISVPSTTAQETLIRHAYSVAGIVDVGATAMVECHGTGTPVGDPLECNAIARIFGGNESGLYIGSVKPNVGHTEGASGLVSIIKMVLALENRTIPPNIRFTSPNPKIPFKEARLTVPTEPTPWPTDKLERVSINSFGIGGSNGHVILDSAATAGITPIVHKHREGPQLLLYSANTANSLDRLAAQYEQWLEKSPEKAGDLAYTLARRREHLRYRSFAVFSENGTATKASPTVKNVRTSKMVMVFTGQGAQWPLMGQKLLSSQIAFQDTIRSLDRALSVSIQGGPGYTIEEELLKPGKLSRIDKAAFSQPLCTAVQIALVETLRSVGIKPDAVVGHSSGEIAAAFASGALTAKEAIIAAHNRGAVTRLQEREGAMAAIGMGWGDTEPYLQPGVVIACDNAPQSVTISGDAPTVKAVVSTIKKDSPGILARLLQVEKAYHSSHMVEIGSDYLRLIGEQIDGKQPSVPFFSSVTGALLSADRSLNAEYLKANLESPVLFQSAVSSIMRHEVGKDAVFLEIGPHSALSAPLRQILTKNSSPSPYVPIMLRNRDCMESFLNGIGKLYTLHVSMDLSALFPIGITIKDLPTYPWNHDSSYWSESRLSQEWRHMKFPYHDLLGVRVTQNTDLEPAWRNMFHLDNAPWIRDHKIGEDIVFPFCGYLAGAGEAVRQLTGIDAGYSVRKMIVSTALVLTEGRPTEMVTTLRPRRLTNSVNSQWWEFTVSAHVGHSWTKHATGEVMAVAEPHPASAAKPVTLPRKVGTWHWYDAMHKNNLSLGHSFQTLDQIEASTDADNLAVAQVIDCKPGDESFYHIHPTRLDTTFQLVMAAAINGYTRKVRCWLPVSVEMITIARCNADMVCEVQAHLSSNQSILGKGRTVSRERTVVEVTGIVASRADNSAQSDSRAFTGCRYTWNSDVHFMDVKPLIHPGSGHVEYMRELDKLCEMCLISSRGKAASVKTSQLHVAKYAAWIHDQANRITSSEHLKEDDTELSTKIRDLVATLSDTPVSAAARTIQKLSDEMDLVLSGKTLDEIVPVEWIRELYRLIDGTEVPDILRYLGHSKPNMTILEIGNGRGSVANEALSRLTTFHGHTLCKKYILTSTGYISDKDQSKAFERMEYLTLDISQNLAEQGFGDREFDLIIVNNVIHSTQSIQASLINCRKLLAPNGRLLLRELSPSSRSVNYIFGAQARWWGAEADGRAAGLCLNTKQWEHELVAAGIDRVEGVAADAVGHNQLITAILASQAPKQIPSRQVSVLCDDCNAAEVSPLVHEFEAAGYAVTMCKLGEQPPADKDIVSLLDINGSYFANLDAVKFQSLKNFVQNLGASGILWITPTCHINCKDPASGQVIGFARAMRSEMLIDFATCEVPSFSSVKDIIRVFGTFSSRKIQEGEQPDFEYVVEEGDIKVGRYYPFRIREELLIENEDNRAVLDVGVPGRVNTLHWLRTERIAPKDDEVEIEVYSAGLNFRDILVAMGIVELRTRQFGLEVSGIVRRTGPKVNNIKIGDRVLSLHRNALGTFTTAPEYLFAKIPSNMTFDQAATLLGSYVTAWYSLINVGHLQSGQTVLIHSACGGVGLAAIQVARMLGADIYVTVGSEEKVRFLMENFRLARNRIFHSRDSSFVDGIKKETGGKGIAVVLNSLSGELLHATWSCVAPWGRMVEIGKRDLLSGGRLDMEPFLANRSYTCVDIDPLIDRAEAMHEVIQSVVNACEQGIIVPVKPIKMFKAAEIQDAFRYMQKGTHIGRIGIAICDPSNKTKQEFEVSKRVRHLNITPGTSYLLVGGLGGLGRAIAVWMADGGAEEIVFMARSAGTVPEHHLLAEELSSMGCTAKFVQGDVTKPEDVVEALKTCTLPLRGIHQMTLVLRDQSFPRMTFDEWTLCVAPKVTGTWNLHNATIAAGIMLDFFVLFSSVSGVVGQHGQANYASANTFLSSMAHYRHGLGLAASVIDIGAVQGIGVVEHIKNMTSTLKSVGFSPLNETQLLDAILVAMTPVEGGGNNKNSSSSSSSSDFTASYAITLGLSANSLNGSASQRVIWRNDRRMALYHNYKSDGGSGDGSPSANEDLKNLLAAARDDASVLSTADAARLLAVEIGRKLFSLLLKPQEDLNIALPLLDLGLDSLVAIELRGWWKQVLKFDISVLEMLGMGSLEALGQHAAEGLHALYVESKA